LVNRFREGGSKAVLREAQIVQVSVKPAVGIGVSQRSPLIDVCSGVVSYAGSAAQVIANVVIGSGLDRLIALHF